MRNTFAREITACALEDDRIVLLSGDIGNRLFDDFRKAAPERFFNCGVAEANMTGVAAGLGRMGFRPVTYTIAPFATIRCLEQIRIDLCYQKIPGIIVGTGAGLSYAELGPTHQSCDDIGILRMLPNMTILSPCDPTEVRLAIRAALRHDGPVYLRLGKKGEPVLHLAEPDFAIGRSVNLRRGSDVCILATGPILAEALAAAGILEREGISTRVESLHTIKPLDTALLAELFATFRLVATLEEHSRSGGLGGSVAEWLADQPSPSGRLLRFGTPDCFIEEIYSQESAREKFGLAAEPMAARIREIWR
jgi:transketolase